MNSLARLLILTVLALGMCGIVTAQTKKPLDALYNAQKDETTYFVSPLVLVKVDVFPTSSVNLKDGVGERPVAGQTIKMVAYTKFTGKSYSTPADVTIAFESYHYRNYQYSADRDLTITTPAQKYVLGKMELTGRRSETMAYYETLEIKIPVAQYREIIQAGKMDLLLGATSFSLTSDQITSLQHIANKYLK